MPAGSSKIGIIGGVGIVPGGSINFNTSSTFAVPVGVETVSITGRGAAGNSGNPGESRAQYNGGGGGGGGGSAQSFTPVPSRSFAASTMWNPNYMAPGYLGPWIRPAFTFNSRASPRRRGGNGGGGNGGFGGTAGGGGSGGEGTAGNPGSGGGATTVGATGTSGSTGQASSIAGYNFAGGSGGTGGAGGAPSPGSNGGSGGNLVPGTTLSGQFEAGGSSPGQGPQGGAAGPSDWSQYTPRRTGRPANGNASAGIRGSGGGGGGALVDLAPGLGGWYGSLTAGGPGGSGGGQNPAPGGAGGSGNPGAAAPAASTVNGVILTPGASYPVTVAPGTGYITISWDPQ